MKRKKCFYTGLDLVDSGRPKANESTPYNSFTLDRINPKLGYVPGNVVPCCFAVNQLKEKLEHSDKDGLSLAHKMKLMKKLLEVL